MILPPMTLHCMAANRGRRKRPVTTDTENLHGVVVPVITPVDAEWSRMAAIARDEVQDQVPLLGGAKLAVSLQGIGNGRVLSPLQAPNPEQAARMADAVRSVDVLMK
jgi:hypothetical protein